MGLIGYTMAMLALLLDIGRPDRFWHALVYWNDHSLLWEVTMCVMLYLTVLVFESLPIFACLDWLSKHFPSLAERMSHLHHYAPYLAIVGLALSSLHQSSLGAIYGVLKARPFWYKPEMSVLFMFSAIRGRHFADAVRLDALRPANPESQDQRWTDRAVSLFCGLGADRLPLLPVLGCALVTITPMSPAAPRAWS